MSQQKEKVSESINWLREYAELIAVNDFDLYIMDDSADKAKLVEDFDRTIVDKQTFYGSLQTDEMLRQFQTLRKGKDYDTVILLTDKGSYELAKDKQELPDMNAPVWMVHFGGELPRAYADATLQAILNSNGGVATDLETVMRRLKNEEDFAASVVGGYRWIVSKSDRSKVSETVSDKGLKAIAVRQLISQLAKKDKDELSIAELDAIHQIAKNNSVVTPYFSMIVLVNDRLQIQQTALQLLNY